MKVTLQSLTPPRKPNVLAHASVKIEFDTHSITISDLRLLRNRSGELWVGMPAIAVSNGGREYRYEPCVEFSRELRRAVEDAVLAAYAESEAKLAVRS